MKTCQWKNIENGLIVTFILHGLTAAFVEHNSDLVGGAADPANDRLLSFVLTTSPSILPAVWRTAHGYRNGICPALPCQWLREGQVYVFTA